MLLPGRSPSGRAEPAVVTWAWVLTRMSCGPWACSVTSPSSVPDSGGCWSHSQSSSTVPSSLARGLATNRTLAALAKRDQASSRELASQWVELTATSARGQSPCLPCLWTARSVGPADGQLGGRAHGSAGWLAWGAPQHGGVRNRPNNPNAENHCPCSTQPRKCREGRGSTAHLGVSGDASGLHPDARRGLRRGVPTGPSTAV